MCYSSVTMYYGIVLFAMVAVPCIECGVIAGKPGPDEASAEFPFIDGLRKLSTARPFEAGDVTTYPTEEVEESDELFSFNGKNPIDDFPFIDGLRRRTTLIPFRLFEESDEQVGFDGIKSNDFPFFGRLRRTTSKPTDLVEESDEQVGFDGVKSNDEYPFIDGLRIRTRKPFFVKSENSENSAPTESTPSSSIIKDSEPSQKDDHYPFIDELLTSTPIPEIVVDPLDTKDSEASNDDHFPFMDGTRKQSTRHPWGDEKFGANLPTFETGNDEYPFINGVLWKNSRPKREQVGFGANRPKFETGHDEYPFINGVLRPTRRPFREQEKFGVNLPEFETTHEEYPFINGLLRHNRPQESEHANSLTFEGSNGDFPFINGRPTRRPRHADRYQESNSVNDEYPFINGLLFSSTPRPSIDSQNVGLGKKANNDLSLYNGPRIVKVASSQNNVRRNTYGDRLDGDRKVFDKVVRKPIRFGHPEITFHAEYPGPNQENSCPINFISVSCTSTLCDGENDKMEIISGGVGQTFFKLRITSYNTHLYAYKVLAYTKCA